MSMQAKVHTEAHRVRSYEVDVHRRATPLCLVNCCQEAAAVHAGLLGVGMEWMLDRGVAWVLTFLELDFHQFPGPHEHLQVHTWPVGANKYYAFRYYHLQSADGRDVARGRSAWAVLDTAKRSLASMPQEVRTIQPPEDPGGALGEPFRPPKLRAPETVDLETPYPVRRADLDMNGHVNNAAFAQWTLESAGDALWETSEPEHLAIAFRAEARYGDTVLATCAAEERDGVSDVAHVLRRAEDGAELVLARSQWRPLSVTA